MKILICGKGGSEKSTISALLAEELASRGYKVLVVDTDESNFGLYKHMGLEQPKDFMESLGGKAGLREKLRGFMKSEGKENPKMIDGQFGIEDIPWRWLHVQITLLWWRSARFTITARGVPAPWEPWPGSFWRS
jgi:CO dehydrogenase maturation factor